MVRTWNVRALPTGQMSDYDEQQISDKRLISRLSYWRNHGVTATVGKRRIMIRPGKSTIPDFPIHGLGT